MAKFFAAADADPALLNGKTIAVVGYGNQGRSQAINLRRSGHQVIVGNQEDESWQQARADGFETFAMDAAAARADVVMLLLPDEIAPATYRELIAPHLAGGGKTLVFASGYNITYKFIAPPRETDVVLVAPRMIGQGVLDLPARGEGFPVLVGVSEDASGHALAFALAITHGIGAFLPHGAVVESSFEEETLVDLFSEHTWAGAMLFLLDRAFKLLVEAGVSKEVALLELYASGELGEIGRAMATLGVWKQLNLHSHTSQFGQLTHGAEFIGADSEALMRKAIDEIRDGTFARRWAAEQAAGSPVFQRLLDERLSSPIATAENELFTRLGRR
ncbi:MAG TPA: ketol-acid reductoisomerase [Candidatus Binataceae bacterium]|nr:ketol-acid reductoisomerase [Candidatus Binataceae bacterium]